jgi:23S rRNA (uracil1939-C5)-methyltransferase
MKPLETKNRKITVDVEKWVYGGDALSRIDGQVLLAPFTLPGERIEVEPERAKGNLLRAHSVQVLERSPRRIEPRCEYFGHCGGCQDQHADYGYQLEQKAAILRETLRRLGGIGFDDEIPIISGDPWGYRNRIQLHFDRSHTGFRRYNSHDLCPISHCPISSPKLNEAIEALNSAMKQPEWPRFLRSLELFTNEKELQLHVIEADRPIAARFFEWCAERIPGTVPGALAYPGAGHIFRISRGAFFQINRFLIDALADEVLGDREGGSAVDLYAGAGLFSLPLAARFARVDAVERGLYAYRDLEANAASTAGRVFPARASAEDYLRQLTVTPDAIIADPPRAGLGPEVTGELLRVGAPRLTIVSCDPATLARDLKVLTSLYRVERLALVDLFPQTFHFETIAHLAVKR